MTLKIRLPRDETLTVRLVNSFNTRNLTLIATLAAVYALGSFLPGFPMVGISGSKIDIVRALEIGYGFILGPIYGPITAFLGALVGKTMSGGGFGMFFTPLAPVSTFMAAVLSRRKVFGVQGWVVASGVLSVMILGWYVTDVGRGAPFYPVFHATALAIILIFRGRLADYMESDDKRELSIGALLCSFPSTMAGHMLGNIIFIVLVPTDPLFFMSLLAVSVVERVVITVLATAIAEPLVLVVRGLYPNLIESSS